MRMLTGNRIDYGKQAKHANGEHSWGVDGERGKAVEMKAYGLYECSNVKVRSAFLPGSSRPRRLTHVPLDPNSQDRDPGEHCDRHCEVLAVDITFQAARILL